MNWPTILVAALVAAVFAAVVIGMIRGKRKGKTVCACGGCSGCAMAGVCHQKK